MTVVFVSRNLLQERLCLVSPILRGAILETIDVCAEAEQLALFQPHGDNTEERVQLGKADSPPVTLEAFRESQREHHEGVRRDLIHTG